LIELEEVRTELKDRLKLAARVAKASKVIGQLLVSVNDENSKSLSRSV